MPARRDIIPNASLAPDPTPAPLPGQLSFLDAPAPAPGGIAGLLRTPLAGPGRSGGLPVAAADLQPADPVVGRDPATKAVPS